MNLLESLPTVIGTAAIAPALLILWLVVAADERPGPPAQGLDRFPARRRQHFAAGRGARAVCTDCRGARKSLGCAGPAFDLRRRAPEEIVKILVIVAVSARRRPFADPMDTVVYGAAAGFGFAAYENLAYLVQHAEMWRSLAALRSVLTVPFHGALGIIAGAYLAIARSGTALGAHRHHRDWARISSRILVVFAPVGAACRVRFSAADAAAKPGHRFVHPNGPGSGQRADRVQLDRLCGAAGATGRPPSRSAHRDRARTAEPVAADVGAAGGGGGAGFAGLAFVLTSIHHWLVNPERNVSLVLIPIGLVSILIGIALLVVTTAIYFLGRNRMRGASQGFSSAPGQG